LLPPGLIRSVPAHAELVEQSKTIFAETTAGNLIFGEDAIKCLPGVG
jgi:hypothetical protein